MMKKRVFKYELFYCTFVPSLLVELCKHLIYEIFSEINEMISAYNTLDFLILDGGSYQDTDEKGMVWIEKMCFDAYNERDILIAAAERYFERMCHYPESIPAEKSTGTEITLPIAESIESTYQGRI